MGKSETMLFRPAERFHLDAGSPVPLYHQLERALLDRIAREDAVGAMLPAEKDLETIFGVSRATVRKAYDNLAARRLIERRRAAGTRVVKHRKTKAHLHTDKLAGGIDGSECNLHRHAERRREGQDRLGVAGAVRPGCLLQAGRQPTWVSGVQGDGEAGRRGV